MLDCVLALSWDSNCPLHGGRTVIGALSATTADLYTTEGEMMTVPVMDLAAWHREQKRDAG